MDRTTRFKKLAQASMGLATNFDEVGATKQTVMSDSRDFSRPRESFYTSNAPTDFFNAEDSAPIKDSFIEGVQKFLQTRPLGVSYTGGVTGVTDSLLLNSLLQLETKLQNKYPDKIFAGTIVNGNKISASGLTRAIKELNGKNVNEVKPDEIKLESPNSIVGDSDIKKFQTFFNMTPTGIVDDKLISAAKAIENKIASVTGNTGAIGLLWNDSSKKFNTTVSDVQEALKKIKEFESAK